MKPIWSPGSLSGVDAVAEAVAAKDLNNLYRTSCFFLDEDRYRAFCALYAMMRVVDDRVDGSLTRRERVADATLEELDIVRAWHRAVRSCVFGQAPDDRDVAGTRHPLAKALLDALEPACEAFPFPMRLWDNFFRAMEQDLQRLRFDSYAGFLDYAEGAAVAPTTIYLDLIASELGAEGRPYLPHLDFELLECGRELGRFAYLAHILRDIAEDLTVGDTGLLYLAADDMARHGVTEATLRADVASRRPSAALRALVRELAERAEVHAVRGRELLAPLKGRLSHDRWLVTELIVRIYEGVLEKIVQESYDVTTDRHRLTEAEKRQIALDVAESDASPLMPDSLVPPSQVTGVGR